MWSLNRNHELPEKKMSLTKFGFESICQSIVEAGHPRKKASRAERIDMPTTAPLYWPRAFLKWFPGSITPSSRIISRTLSLAGLFPASSTLVLSSPWWLSLLCFWRTVKWFSSPLIPFSHPTLAHHCSPQDFVSCPLAVLIWEFHVTEADSQPYPFCFSWK